MLADVREDHDQLPPGVYDVLITRELAARIKGGGLQPQWEDVDDAAQPDMFARHLARLARTRLAGSDASERVELFNRMAAEIAGDEHAIDEPRRSSPCGQANSWASSSITANCRRCRLVSPL